MRARLVGHLTYANVMATLGVFIALGGTSYAAITITGRNVKNGSLTGTDVKNNSLTGRDVKSLTAGDFKRGTLPTGPRGAAGSTGPQGPQGEAGASAATAYASVSESGTLSFGRGVTSVSATGSTYTVRFSRSLTNCALSATQGFGTPSSGSNSTYSQIQVTAAVIGGDAIVNTTNPSNGAGKPAAFFLAVLC